MFWNHWKELLGILMIGEGVVVTLWPLGHLSLWQNRSSPAVLREIAAAFARHPMLTRVLGLLELGLGARLVLRQFSESGVEMLRQSSSEGPAAAV